MEVRETKLGSREIFENYMAQINWDWLFLRAQLVFSGIFLLGIITFILWFLR